MIKNFSLSGLVLFVFSFLWATNVLIGGQVSGQVSPITSSGLGTNVSAPKDIGGGITKFDITGGTRPGGGANLFHSFGEFGVPANNIANFLNDSARPTANILSRVTGGNPSNIFGTIRTEGFPNANLFLMNPAGIVFGPNAALNVGGAAHFTTADYLRLSDGVQFTAMPSAQDALLSVAPVEAFGFLNSNPPVLAGGNSAAILVEGLDVLNGNPVSFIGRDAMADGTSVPGVVLTEGVLRNPGGSVKVASVGGQQVPEVQQVLVNVETLNVQGNNAQGLSVQEPVQLGGILLSEGGTLDASGEIGGSVVIRGGQLMMTNATISADTIDTPSSPMAIDIKVTGDITVSSETNSALTARTTGSGDAGEIRIESKSLTVDSSISDGITGIIDTGGVGTGNSGNITLDTGDLAVTGIGDLFIESGTGGEGNGGNVTITAEKVDLTDTRISTGDGNLFGLGSGGNLSIHSNSLKTEGVSINTNSFNAVGGNLLFNAQNISLKDSSIGVLSLLGESAIAVIAKDFAMDNSQLLNQTASAASGGININAETVNLTNFSKIASQTFGDGDAGAILVNATKQVMISDVPAFVEPDPGGLFTNSFGDPQLGTNGKAGNIEIVTPLFTMNGGARLSSTTGSSGDGGAVSVFASTITISGQRNTEVDAELFNLGGTRASGIYTRTVGTDGAFCTGLCGNAGNITITTGSFNVIDGAVVDSGTTSTGQGGSINVNASGNISIAGTLDDATSGGVFSRTTGTDSDSGAGGTIGLNAGQNFTLSDGATVSTSSEGPGDAGDVTVTAGDTILIDKGTVTTEAARASGGNIKLTADDTIQLVDSTIASSVEGDVTTKGGNINLDPDFITLQNSQILAKAGEGKGGNIRLFANDVVLVDPFSVLDASSALGIDGSVNIQAPVQFLSGTIAPLPQNPAPVTALYGTRCVAGEGGHFSTFVDSKSDSLAPPPGTFLASPLLPQLSSPRARTLDDTETPSKVSEPGHAAPLQVAAYSPPVLFGQSEEVLSACP